MSHIVTIRTEIRDPVALAAACRRLHLEPPVQGEAKLFSGTASGWIVQLPGWHYPVVVDPGQRQIHYDNYNGRWGEQRHLDRMRQAYATEKVRIEARRQGHSVSEQVLPDGSIKVTVQLRGEA